MLSVFGVLACVRACVCSSVDDEIWRKVLKKRLVARKSGIYNSEYPCKMSDSSHIFLILVPIFIEMPRFQNMTAMTALKSCFISGKTLRTMKLKDASTLSIILYESL
jgi:hypothetical protein